MSSVRTKSVFVLILLIVCCWVVAANAQKKKQPSKKLPKKDSTQVIVSPPMPVAPAAETVRTVKNVPVDTLRKIPNKAFAAGEYLKYNVIYGPVTAGEAVMKISDTLVNSRKCFKVEFLLNSKPFFDYFYRVSDRYQTLIDAEGMFPWEFEQHIRESSFKRDFTAQFDQIQHIAKTTEGEYKIPPYVHDIMSAFYFARTMDFSGFTVGQKIHLQNFYKDSTYELDVKFKGRQTIEVEAGTFRCIVIEPLAREGGLFKSDGRVFVWLTDDDRKLPIKVSSKIAIGSVDSELIEFSGVNGSLDAKVKEE
jgi:hypothetical protein